MRDFYKTYENDQTRLRLAMKIGWTLNVVIMEAELTSEARKWYLEQARERQWPKKELLNILSSGYEPDAEAEQKIDQENSSLRFPENCGIIKTDEPRTLDFSGVRGFLVTNVCIVQRSAA